ncbi:MAG: regulatory protein RecX [Methylococcaceae bacterium]|nr:regulatory protein RecX [Methylococcaceae bacterium]
MSSTHQQIKASCLRLLARREHSQLELLTKLALKDFEEMEIQDVIDELATKNLQSDARFAESYARMRFNKGFGVLKVAYELKQRGINDFDLQAVIVENFGDEQTLIQQVYQKKYALEVELSLKERLKRQRFLEQRGFSYEHINALFK